MSIGQVVRKRRIELGLSLQEAAEKTGLWPGHLSEIENDKRTDPQVSTIKKLSKGLKISARKLLDGEQEAK